MRVAFAIVMALGLCSCQQMQSLRIAEQEQSRRIAVGDTLEDARRRIHAADGRDCVSGMLSYPDPSWYFERKDGTAFEVTARPTGKPDQYVIVSLTLGEPGRGFGGDKITWLNQQKRDVEVIDLE